MDNCRYCRREVASGTRTCEDCADFAAAVRVADRILKDSDVESGALAATLGAEIMQEYFLRSLRGVRARHVAELKTAVPALKQRPLV